MAERVTDRPWDGSPSRFTDEQYRRSCVLDRGGDETIKARCSLPVLEPDGTLNRRAVHAAAAMIGKVTGASAEALRAAARKLVAAYRRLGEAPPDGLLRRAGMAAAETEKPPPEQRTLDGEVEERSAPESLTVEGRKLRGVIPYETRSRDLGGWSEVMRRGCLSGANLEDLVATVDHAGLPLGRFPGTLAIEDRDDGLHWAVDLPESRADVREAVERGDLRASSWRMVVARDSWAGNVRTVEEVRSLRDVAVVTTSAYPSAAAFAELRSAPEEEEQMEPEELENEETREEPPRGGTLTVEDRSATPNADDFEARVLDAMRAVPQGESRDLTTAAGSAGPVEPPELSTRLWDRLRDQAVVLASGVPVITTSRNSIKWPRLIGDMTSAFYNELEEIAESDPDLDEFEVEPKAIKALVRGSSEAFEDSDPDLLDLLRSHLNTVLALKLDRELLVGNDAKGFPGLTNAAGITTLDAAGAMTNWDLFLRAIGILAGKFVPPPYALIQHPWTETALALLKKETGSNESLARPAGVPQPRTTTQLGWASGPETSSALVFAPAQLAVVRRRDVTVEVDRSQEFTKDAVLVRAKVRATLFLPYPEAVVEIINVPAPDPA